MHIFWAYIFWQKFCSLFGKLREKEKENNLVGIMFLQMRAKVLPKKIFPHFLLLNWMKCQNHN
jgi:hypothetical protein